MKNNINMKLISHRGNINGRNIERENSPDYILEAIKLGYNVEIDVWFINDKWYLGHDNPQYETDIRHFLGIYNRFLWCHTKNIDALYWFRKDVLYKFNYFWHQEDNFTLTSNNHIWTFPGQKLTSKSICVLPENVNYSNEELKICYGICSDFIENYKSRT
jgi:hypothetical protein